MRVRIAVVAMMVLFAQVAAAGPTSQEKADALFKKGKTLLGQQQYADACAAFAESHKLDPAIGTVLNLALCFEGWGKVASAQKAYLEAEKLAAIKGDQKRASAARQRADALTPRIPKIVFTGLPDALPPDLTVAIDADQVGLDALRTGISVDPGPHVVHYSVEGAKKTIKVEMAESTSKEVKLDLPEPKVETGPDPGTGNGTGTGAGIGAELDDPPVKGRGRGRRITGLVVGGAGVVATGVGVTLALMARSDYNSAYSAHCDETGCDDVGYKATHDARSKANVATIIVGVGAAAIATGVILYLTAPSGKPAAKREHVWIRPVVTDGGGAIVIGGAL
jgi:hypothetical protein